MTILHVAFLTTRLLFLNWIIKLFREVYSFYMRESSVQTNAFLIQPILVQSMRPSQLPLSDLEISSQGHSDFDRIGDQYSIYIYLPAFYYHLNLDATKKRVCWRAGSQRSLVNFKITKLQCLAQNTCDTCVKMDRECPWPIMSRGFQTPTNRVW